MEKEFITELNKIFDDIELIYLLFDYHCELILFIEFKQNLRFELYYVIFDNISDAIKWLKSYTSFCFNIYDIFGLEIYVCKVNQCRRIDITNIITKKRVFTDDDDIYLIHLKLSKFVTDDDLEISDNYIIKKSKNCYQLIFERIDEIGLYNMCVDINIGVPINSRNLKKIRI